MMNPFKSVPVARTDTKLLSQQLMVNNSGDSRHFSGQSAMFYPMSSSHSHYHSRHSSHPHIFILIHTSLLGLVLLLGLAVTQSALAQSLPPNQSQSAGLFDNTANNNNDIVNNVVDRQDGPSQMGPSHHTHHYHHHHSHHHHKSRHSFPLLPQPLPSFVNSLDDVPLESPHKIQSLSHPEAGGSTVTDQLSSQFPTTATTTTTNQYSLPNSRQFFASTAIISSSPKRQNLKNKNYKNNNSISRISRNSNFNARSDRNSKLEKEFMPQPSTNLPIEPAIENRAAAAAVPAIESRKPGSQPGSNGGGQSPSGMDDIIGGLLQLMGGNLKMPAGHQQSKPLSPQQIDSKKLANLINQFGGGAAGGGSHPQQQLPFGPNGYPRLPPQLQQMRPNNGQTPNINLVKLQHQLAAAAAASANHHNGNNPNSNRPPFPMYPFIPLMGSGNGPGTGNGRPPSIPLMSPIGGAGNKYSGGIPPGLPPMFNGMTKSEMEQLYNQFVSGSSQDKSNILAEMMLSKLKHPSQHPSQHLVPSKISSSGTPSSSIEPSFIMSSDDSGHHGHHGHHSSSSWHSLPTEVPILISSSSSFGVRAPPGGAANSLEPQIITMQEEPSIFEMVVKHKIGPSVGPAISAGIDEIDPTKILIPKSSSTSNQIKPTKTVQRYLTITSSKSAEPFPTTLVSNQSPGSLSDVAQIRNQHNKQKAPSSATGIVYGKPATTTSSTLHPSFSTSGNSGVNSGISGTAFNGHQSRVDGQHSASTTTTTTTTATISAVGQPIVRPVQMDAVKPKVGMVRPPTSPGAGIEPSRTDVGGNNNRYLSSSSQALGTGSSSVSGSSSSTSSKKSHNKPRRPQFRPRPNVPIVRIDTCIVGDDSTCDVTLNEKCLTELGLSSCQCRPGFGRVIPRTACVPISSLAISFRVDRMGSNKVQFTRPLLNSNSEEYQYLEYESMLALNSLFTSTKSLDSDLMGVRVNRFYSVGGRTIVNATISLRNNDTGSAASNPHIKRLLQQELTTAITGFNNQLGDSQLWVESAGSAISRIDDLNECSSTEYNDCSKHATCYNEFGGFRCECEPGYEDKAESMMSGGGSGSGGDMRHRTGRICTTCSPQYCSNRGECLVVRGERVCKCRANFIGTQCDIDVEVLGVAIGGSIAALIIIVITFICLYMWNQRFKQEQQKIEAMSAASGHTFSYVNKHHHHLHQAHLNAQSHPQPGPPTMSRMSIDERYGRSWANHHYNSDSQQHLLGATSSSNNTASSYYGVTNQAADQSPQTAGAATTNTTAATTVGQNVYATPVRVINGGSSAHHHHQSSPVGSSGSGTSSGTSGYEPPVHHRTQSHSRHSSGHNSNTLGHQHHFGAQSDWASQTGHRSGGMRSLKTKSRNGTSTIASGQQQHQAYYPYHTMKYPSQDGNFNETEFSTRELIYSPAHQLYATNSRPNLYY